MTQRIAYEINEYNPVSLVWDAVSGYFTGADRFGNPLNTVSSTYKLAAALPIGKAAGAVNKVGGAVVKGGTSLAKTPVGRTGNILNTVTKNSPTTINGTKFTGHALDQMQARGILSPSAVIDIIKNPVRIFPGNTPGTSVFIRDNLKIITNKAGDIITVIPQ